MLSSGHDGQSTVPPGAWRLCDAARHAARDCCWALGAWRPGSGVAAGITGGKTGVEIRPSDPLMPLSRRVADGQATDPSGL